MRPISVSRCRVALRLGLLPLVLACNEPGTGPPPPAEFDVSPSVLWGVGELTLTSPAFRDLVLVPQAGPDGFFDVPNRWSNFAVALGGDTLDSWRMDQTTIAAWVPAGRMGYRTGRATGTYAVHVVVDGNPLVERDMTLIGIRDAGQSDYWPYDEAPIPYPWGLPLQRGAGTIVTLARDDLRRVGAAVLDLNNRTTRMLGDWRAARGWTELEGVGASYDPNRIVLDSSEAGTWAASYRMGQTLDGERRLHCAPVGYFYFYMAAEVASGQCLAWIGGGTDPGYWGNGQTLLQRTPELLYTGTLPVFRMSPGGSRTVAEFAYCNDRVRGGWPVFDATPAVVYRLPGVGCVTGAAFSADGDTLFLVASDTADAWDDVSWMLQVRRAADGMVIRSAPIADASGGNALRALLLDPMRPWLYVTGSEPAYGSSDDVLRVVHRESLEMLASVPGIGWREPHSLVFGGSNGAVYVYSVHEGHWVYIRAVDTPARYPP